MVPRGSMVTTTPFFGFREIGVSPQRQISVVVWTITTIPTLFLVPSQTLSLMQPLCLWAEVWSRFVSLFIVMIYRQTVVVGVSTRPTPGLPLRVQVIVIGPPRPSRVQSIVGTVEGKTREVSVCTVVGRRTSSPLLPSTRGLPVRSLSPESLVVILVRQPRTPLLIGTWRSPLLVHLFGITGKSSPEESTVCTMTRLTDLLIRSELQKSSGGLSLSIFAPQMVIVTDVGLQKVSEES